MTSSIQTLKQNSPFAISLALHGLVFVIGLAVGAPTTVDLPVGVELMYGDGGTDVAPKVEEVVVPKKAPRPQVVDNTDGPEIADKKVEKTEVAQEPTPANTGKSAGSLAGTSTQGALTGREGVANGIEVSPEQRYLYEIKKLLERRKRYPMMAKKMGQAGTVTMRFTLAADGSLVESEVLDKAPFESLNQAAVDLVKGIHGMKPFPNEIQRTSWSITVPIEYVLN